MNSKLLVYLILFLIITCFDNVINVRWIDSVNNYTLFAGAILFPLSGVAFFAIPMFFLKYKGEIHPHNTTEILSHKDLIIIALCDSLNSVLQSIATPYLSVLTMTVFNRLSLVGIPIASKFILGKRYLPSHYLGIFLTMFGISITFIPSVIKHEQVANVWLLMYILGIIPAIASFIYKEKRLEKQPEIWWFNTWVCFYQLIIGVLLLPFNILLTSTHSDMNFIKFGKQIGDGFVCQFAGKNMEDGDNCEYALWWFLLFSLLTTFMNTLMLIIIRDGSSVLFVITNTLKTPITSFLGSFKVLAGKNTSSINIADGYAFVMLIVSSIVYNWNEEVKKEDKIDFKEYHPLDENVVEVNIK